VAIDTGGAIGIASVLSSRTSVVPHVRWAHHPAWSPVSDELAYVNEHDEIWVTNVDGTDKRRLSRRASEDTFNLTWSPDGSEVAFTGRKGDGTIGLIVARADGSGDRELFAWHDWGGWPVWSPTGDLIAFEMPTGPYREPILAVASPNEGGGVWPIGSGTLPSWAPDGRSLVAERGAKLVRMPIGLAPESILPTGLSLNLQPSWSPDERQVAFVGAGRCGEWGHSRRGVYSIRIGEKSIRAVSASLRELLEGGDCTASEG